LDALRATYALVFSYYGDTKVSELAMGWIELSHWFIEQFGEFQNCLAPARRAFVARFTQAYGPSIGEAAGVPALPALRLWQCAIDPIHERFLCR
jgi:hypothetical protein